MLVNSIVLGRDLFVNKVNQNNSMASMPYVKNTNSVDTVSFTGLRPEIIRNQFKILLSQDIWATKLAVKMPEGGLEKEALLEILEYRAKLDKYARLNNRRAEILTKISHVEHLSKTDPTNPELAQTLAELEKLGNLESVLKTLERQINEEAVRNKPALEYFENLGKLEDEYFSKKFVRLGQMEKFWHKVLKGNINAEGKYSTPELIEIIKTGKLPTDVAEATSTIPRITSKKDMLMVVKMEYRRLLRESVNVYNLNSNQTAAAKSSQQKLQEMYATELQRYGIDSGRLDDIYKYVEREFNTQIDNIMDIDIYPLGEHWQQMSVVENKLRVLRREVAQLIGKRSDGAAADLEANKLIDAKLSEIETAKSLWLAGARKSVEYEAVNREMMDDAGKLRQYEYLVGENKILKMHKEALKVCEENEGVIPEEMWGRILSL